MRKKRVLVLEKKGINSLARKPSAEKELFVLQYLYRAFRDEQSWQNFYLMVDQYVNSFVLQIAKSKKVFLPEDLVESKKNEIVIEFMEKYLNPEDNYYIEASFGGNLQRKTFQEVFGSKDEDLNISLNGDTGSGKELLDGEENVGMDNFMVGKNYEDVEEDLIANDTDISAVVAQLLSELDEVTPVYYSILVRIMLLRLCLGDRSILGKKRKNQEVAPELETVPKALRNSPKAVVVYQTFILELRKRLS